MGGSNENFLGVNAIRHSNIQDFGFGVGNNNNARKPLSTINSNIIRTEKNGACSKNPIIPVHRPITRKFAAQLAGQEQQPPLEKIKKPEEEDVPIYVQYTEAMLEEIDRMDDEIEMENIDWDEPVVDIDSCDNKNPLAVTEYIDDIYTYYRKTEKMSCVPPNYMTNQFDINERMRAILMDWLIEVHYKFELMDETLYLTVNLIDRFLSVKPIVRKKLQLVGIAAMLLACKYEEVFVPVIEDLILISDKAYCRKEILDMEKLMINTLQFNMSFPNPYVFMRRFIKAAQSDKRLELLSFFIIELCLVEYDMLRFPPSLLAAAAIFTAECATTGRKRWSKTSERHTNYTQDELLECARLMVSFHRSSGTGKLKGVYNKYSTLKYGYAAKAEPAVFLIDDEA